MSTNVTKYGKGAAGLVVTQIATWSPILNQNTLMSNPAFNIQMTLRTTSSLAILDKAGPRHAMATCQIQSRNPANKGKTCNSNLETSHISRHANFQGITASHTAVLEDLVQACIKDAFTHQRAKASAQVVLTEDKRKTVYQNLHTSLPSSITTSGADTLAIEITEDDDTLGKFTQPDLLLITNGTLPSEEFPITTKKNPRKLNANSISNRARQFGNFIDHCAKNGLKYEYFDVHFSHKDDKALENNERIKRTGYERAFDNFADKARDSTHPFHRTYQQMKRINHHRGGAPKVTPFGVNIYGILSKDAHQAMGRLSEIRFPETPHCLSYLSARQKWIGWWIRVIQKYISESVVCGIEAGFKHRARLANDLLTASHNQMGSPVQRPLIQIGMHKWGLQQEPKATVNFTAKQASASTVTPRQTPTTRTSNGKGERFLVITK